MSCTPLESLNATHTLLLKFWPRDEQKTQCLYTAMDGAKTMYAVELTALCGCPKPTEAGAPPNIVRCIARAFSRHHRRGWMLLQNQYPGDIGGNDITQYVARNLNQSVNAPLTGIYGISGGDLKVTGICWNHRGDPTKGGLHYHTGGGLCRAEVRELDAKGPAGGGADLVGTGPRPLKPGRRPGRRQGPGRKCSGGIRGLTSTQNGKPDT